MKILICLISLSLISFHANASINKYLGTWVNTNKNTRGVTKIQIKRIRRRGSKPQVMVRAWGQCHPRDCNWGQQKATLFAPSVSSNALTNTAAVTVIFNQGFSIKTLTMKSSGRLLVVNLFSLMNDNRSNYHTVHRFRKARRVGRVIRR